MSNKYYGINSKYCGTQYEWFENDPEFTKEYLRQRACSPDRRERHCYFDKFEFQLRPTPLHAVVMGTQGGFCACLDTPVVLMLRADARLIFEPYLPHAVWGDVHRRLGSKLVHTGYYTCLLPRSEWVDCNRGHNYLEKTLCHVCGQVNGLASRSYHHGLLRRETRDRPVVISENLYLCVTPNFYEEQELEKRLPDIKIVYKIKVYDEDPAGWVLPGDPGWNGVLVQRTEPEKPPKKKKK
jgi:hypothetical protein